MKRKIVYILIFVILVLFGKNAYCQYLSERDKEIYYEIMKREYQLAKQNPDLMDKGDYYYTDQMEGNVHNVVARKYGITINQAWDIMQRGLSREITAQEKELIEKVNAEIESLSDDSSTPEQIEELGEKAARKYGTTFDVLCELERRMWQQMPDWDDDDWDDEWE